MALEILDRLDELQLKYDTRILTAALMERASANYNALWRTGILARDEIDHIYEYALELALDESRPVPPVDDRTKRH